MTIIPSKPSEVKTNTKITHKLLLDCLERLSIALVRSGKDNGTDKLGTDYDFLDGYNELYLVHFKDLPHVTELLGDTATAIRAKDSILELLQQ